ncbi:MAG: type III-B CRISPR module RAMP protein Cmr4 [Candidatus Xenobia bacterium]
MNAQLLFLHVLSPLHTGIGQGVGVIDLPIAREKSTNIPCLPGSSVKGVLRAACDDRGLRTSVFGPDTQNASDHAGAVQFSDLTLLCLPVRSLYGTFAWVTSPYLLRRLARDISSVCQKPPGAIPTPTEEQAKVAPGATVMREKKVILEDLDLPAAEDPIVRSWAQWIGERVFHDADWNEAMCRQITIVHDNVMSYLLDTATEVVARIALDEEKKTVRRGALWYEEALPTESILWGLAISMPVRVRDKVIDSKLVFETVDNLVQKPVQLGGHASVGRGLCKLRMVTI